MDGGTGAMTDFTDDDVVTVPKCWGWTDADLAEHDKRVRLEAYMEGLRDGYEDGFAAAEEEGR
jgi:hypothetical protein